MRKWILRILITICFAMFVIGGLWFGIKQVRSSIKNVETEIKKEIIGAVIPHYSIVLSRIEEEWRALAKETKPDLIILVGPDHNDVGDRPITSPIAEQAMSYQPLAKDIAHQLVLAGIIRADDSVIGSDHAFLVHTPFLRKYFPVTPVLALAMRSDVTQEQVQRLTSFIKPLLPSSTLIVASVDFSHYKTKDEAIQYDAETIDVLERGDTASLFTYHSEHLDSRGSMALFIGLVCSSSCTWQNELHGNSGDLGSDPQEPTTSFFFLRALPRM